MSRTLWINPFNGIAGDMLLGALIDAGADLDWIRATLEQTGVGGWSLTAETTDRNGIRATNLHVTTDEGDSHRTAADIIGLVQGAGLPERVTQRATDVFAVLAVAEGAVHGQDPETVHFHEVGGIDAIVDVVGCCLALEQLDVSTIVAGPVALGQGTARSAHGLIPNPAPATIRLLTNFEVIGLDTPIELTTPTGAALLAALATSGPMPAMTIEASGFGAGDAQPADMPNVVHVILGQPTSVSKNDRLVVIESNIDDATGETLGHTIDRLVGAGAKDVWVTPIVMKKGRPAHVISVLADVARAQELGAMLLGETGSIGYRSSVVDRVSMDRWIDTVLVGGHEIAIKVTPHRSKAEHVDVVAAAAALGRPAREVAAEAEALWRAGNRTDLR